MPIKVELKGVSPKGGGWTKTRHLPDAAGNTESSIMLYLKTKDNETMGRIKEGYEIAIVKIG